MTDKKNKKTFDETKGVLNQNLVADKLQEEFVSDLVDQTMVTKAEGFLRRKNNLMKQGKLFDDDSVIESLTKTEKGFVFEGMNVANHLGKGPKNKAFFGKYNDSSLKSNDPGIDYKLNEVLVQAKNRSPKEIIKALKNPEYEGKILQVPSDTLEKLKNKKNLPIEVKEAIKRGKITDSVGDAHPLTTDQINQETRKALRRNLLGKKESSTTKNLNLGLSVAKQGFIFSASIDIFRKAVSKDENLFSKESGKEILQNALISGAASGSKAVITRTVYNGLIKRGFNGGGRWLSNSVGGGVNLVWSLGKDTFDFISGDITGKELGLNLAKNTSVLAATLISGPLGLFVSIGYGLNDLRNSYNAGVTNIITEANNLLDSSNQKIAIAIKSDQAVFNRTEKNLNNYLDYLND
jgi:hypothetical protein